MLFSHSVPQFDPIKLVERYRAYRLPEPPMDAIPVLCTDASTVQLPGFARAGKLNIVYRPWNPCRTEPAEDQTVEPLAGARIKRIDYGVPLWPTVAVLESRGESQAVNRILQAVFVTAGSTIRKTRARGVRCEMRPGGIGGRGPSAGRTSVRRTQFGCGRSPKSTA